jgi:hypothetical protein
MKIWSLVLIAVLALSGVEAEAGKRLGGGKSVGKQSTNVTQRDAAPAAPGSPAVAPANAAPKAAPQRLPRSALGARCSVVWQQG